MASTKLQAGEVITVTAPEAVSLGEVVAIGNLVGVALAAADNGAPVEIDTSGVWRVAKTTGAGNDIAAGANVYLVPASDAVNDVATDQIRVGVAIAAATTTDTTVDVKLNAGAHNVVT